MANDLNLALRIRVNADGTAQVLSGVENSVNRVGTAASHVGSNMTTAAAATSAASQRMASGMSSAASAANHANQQITSLTNALSAAATVAASAFSVNKITQEMGGFEAKMINVHALTQANAADMKAMEAEARALGATTSFNSQQAAESMGVLASAGLKTNEILSATPQILELAAAGNLDMSRSAEIAIGTLRGMGLALGDLGRISDVVSMTASETFAGVGDIGDAMKNASPLARAFNIDLEDMAAAIGILADNQIKGGEAGNNFKAMLAALGNETKERTELLAQHGLAYKDLNIQIHGFVPVMDTLRKAHLSGAEAMTLFGTDAAAAGLILSVNSEKLGTFAEKLDGAAGSTKKMATDLNTGLIKSIDAFGGVMTEAALQLGDESGGGLLSGMTRLIQQATGVILVYEGLGVKFAESNNLTKEQYVNLKSIADELEIVAGAAGGIATLTAGIWLANTAMVAFNATARLNPFILIGTVAAAGIGAMVGYINTAKRAHEDLMKSATTLEDSNLKISQQIAKINKVPPGMDKMRAARIADLEILVKQHNALVSNTSATQAATEVNKSAGDALGGLANHQAAVAETCNKLTDTNKKAAAEAKKAAQEEEKFWQNALGFLKGQAEKLNILKLSGKEQALETEISRNLNTVLGETYDKTQSLTAAKQQLVDEVVSNTRQIYAETEAIARQQAMWDELVKQANALTDLKRGAEDMQSLANMAKTLSVMGATNEEVAKRITLEQKLRGIVSANPDLNEQQVRDYVIAEQRAADEIAQYTNTKTDESAQWMEAAFKKAAENIQDSFATMFENMLNGDATASFAKFAENIKKTLNQAISQQLSLDLQNLFTGKGGLGDMFKSTLLFGVSMITSLLTQTATRTYSPSETGNSPVTGTGAMHIADSFARDQGFAFQSKTIMAFNKSLDFLSSSIMSNTGKITEWISGLGSKLASITVFNQVANFFKPVASLIGDAVDSVTLAYSKVTDFLNYGITAVTDLVGLTSKATVVVDAISTSAAGTGTAAEAAGTSAVESAGMTALEKVSAVLAVIKLGYDAFTIWSNDALTTHTKITNTLYATADALAGIALATFNPAIAIAYAVVNTMGVISDVIENGFSRENVMRFFFGPLSGLISSLIWEPRVPNVWMNTYNPDQSGGQYASDPNASTYTTTGNKSAYVGESTPFGMTVISTHEMSLSAQEMVNAFGGLLKTIKTVDINLYNTVMRLDTAMGQTGKTMDFYNNLLGDGNQGVTSVATKQNASDLNTGQLLSDRYTWIIDRLAASGSVVGQYLNAWFDVITSKFIAVSKDNSMFVLGVINSLANNIESFMQFPLSLVNLIGQSVKSTSSGGTPDTVMAEITDVFNTYQMVKNGLAYMTLGGNQGAINEGIVSFLANVNSMGYAVKDAGINLLAYAIAIQKTGALGSDALTVITNANNKLSSLKLQGLDNTQITAYLGSFGLMASLFAEAKVSFTEADLDTAAQNIHKLSQASVDVAKNVVDHAIADAQLTTMTRAAAIATLVKNKTLDEATVAEAEYGLSIQKNTKAVLEQMSFIQQLGYMSGKSLGEMSISASTWQSAAANVVTVFGDMATAMGTLDDIAKNFMSAKDYAQYNLETINRSIANMQSANSALTGITASSITTMIKNGTLTSNMINGLAAGLGESSTEALAYIKLIGQQLTAQTALANAINNTTEATNGLGEAQKLLDDALTKTARDNLAEAYKKESSVLTDTIKKINDFTKSFKDFRDALTTGDLSTSTPAQKYKDTGDQYRATLSAVNAGAGSTDASKQVYDDAVSSIQAKATAFLSASRDYNASSAAYKTDYNAVLGAIDGMITTVGTGKTVAETALTELTSAVDGQIKGLTTLNDSVLSVKDAIFELNTASFEWIKGYLNIDDKTALADTIKTWQTWFYTYLDDKSGGQLTAQNGVLGVSGNALVTPDWMISDYFDRLVKMVKTGGGGLPDFTDYINQAMNILANPQIVIRNQGAPYTVDPATGNPYPATPAVDPNADSRKSPDKKPANDVAGWDAAIAELTDKVNSIPDSVRLWFDPKTKLNSTVIADMAAQVGSIPKTSKLEFDPKVKTNSAVIADMAAQVGSIPDSVRLWFDPKTKLNSAVIDYMTAQVDSIPNEVMLWFDTIAIDNLFVIDELKQQVDSIPNEVMLSFTRDIKHNNAVINYLNDQVDSIHRVVTIALEYTQPSAVMGPSPATVAPFYQDVPYVQPTLSPAKTTSVPSSLSPTKATTLTSPNIGAMKQYAYGGIANQASIFGEAGPEAAVPLPDGRSIPVTLSQPAGRSDNTDIVEQLKAALTEQQKQNAVLQQALLVMQAGFSQLVARSDEQQQTLEAVERQLRRSAA